MISHWWLKILSSQSCSLWIFMGLYYEYLWNSGWLCVMVVTILNLSSYMLASICFEEYLCALRKNLFGWNHAFGLFTVWDRDSDFLWLGSAKVIAVCVSVYLFNYSFIIYIFIYYIENMVRNSALSVTAWDLGRVAKIWSSVILILAQTFSVMAKHARHTSKKPEMHLSNKFPS